VSFPAFAQRVTVLGSTRKRVATSAGVEELPVAYLFETFGTSQSVLGNQGLLPFLCVMRGKYLLNGQKLQELLYIACS
jgi:hypothetical protein